MLYRMYISIETFPVAYWLFIFNKKFHAQNNIHLLEHWVFHFNSSFLVYHHTRNFQNFEKYLFYETWNDWIDIA